MATSSRLWTGARLQHAATCETLISGAHTHIKHPHDASTTTSQLRCRWVKLVLGDDTSHCGIVNCVARWCGFVFLREAEVIRKRIAFVLLSTFDKCMNMEQKITTYEALHVVLKNVLHTRSIYLYFKNARRIID